MVNLRGLGDRHQRRVFGPKREEIIGGCKAWSSLIFICCRRMQGYFLKRLLHILKPFTQNIWMLLLLS
jgi:hypothetical protein